MHPVYTKSLTRAERRKHWQRIITDWRDSDLKRNVFCEQQQIKLADLRRWSYRLNQMNKQQLISTPKPHSVSQGINPSIAFIPIEISSPADSMATGSIQLQHQSGFSLTVSVNTDEQLLKKAIKLLREAGC